MKLRISVAAFAVLTFVAVTTSNAAEPQRDTRSVRDFSGIAVGGSIELQLTQGRDYLVEVESPDGDPADVITEVRNGTLHLRQEKSGFPFFFGGNRARHIVKVTLPSLVELSASGGSDVDSHGRLSGDKLEITASGGADVDLDIAVASLAVQASGGADVDLSGTASTMNLSASGGSDLDAGDLTSETATLTGSGGADIEIGPTGALVANASGGSDIAYKGEPRSLTTNVSGGGKIRRH